MCLTSGDISLLCKPLDLLLSNTGRIDSHSPLFPGDIYHALFMFSEYCFIKKIIDICLIEEEPS